MFRPLHCLCLQVTVHTGEIIRQLLGYGRTGGDFTHPILIKDRARKMGGSQQWVYAPSVWSSGPRSSVYTLLRVTSIGRQSLNH